MVDIFESRNIEPMLIAEMHEPFDNPDYIFELKLDGVRCLAYLDEDSTDLRNKRNLKVSPIYPELKDLHMQVKKPCILDGELIVVKEGKPYFAEMQRRALMSNKFKIELSALKLPVSFTAYDILYLDDKQVTDLPLMERKALLQENVIENDKLSISRYIEEKGIDLYALTVKEDLEGIVAKRKNSRYYFGKKTKDWTKIKYLKDDDFVIAGYIEKEKHTLSIVIAQYQGRKLIYKGHVAMSNRDDYLIITSTRKIPSPKFEVTESNEETVWIEPKLVCTVHYMNRSATGYLRQPIYRGLREDKRPEECVEANWE